MGPRNFMVDVGLFEYYYLVFEHHMEPKNLSI